MAQFDHRWQKRGDSFVCRWCERTVPNNPHGRAYALGVHPCSILTPAQQRERDEASDAVDAEIEVAKAALAAGQDRDEVYATLSQDAKVELHRRNGRRNRAGLASLAFIASALGAGVRRA